MRTNLLIIVISLIVVTQAAAQKYVYLIAGGNCTTFRGEKTYLQAGSSIGVGRQWDKRDNPGWLKNTAWALEIIRTEKRALLKNKTIGGGLDYDDIVSYNDIYCSLVTLETSVLFIFERSLYKKLKLNYYLGPALSIPIMDRSRKYRQRVKLLEPDQRSNYPFDYVVNPGDPMLADNWGFIFNFGIGLFISSISFDIRLSPALLYEIATITAINFHETPDTFHTFITLKYNIE
jgi:hypothetical protein